MKLKLQSERPKATSINITGSKSESNRLLILKALFPNLKIQNLSNSDDTQVLEKALGQSTGTINIHHAGTAMRFLTAYYALTPNKDVVLTGSQRMQERPISILVDALRSLGATISYGKEDGFPPLIIKGLMPTVSEVSLNANVSSQYISALMLVAPSLPKGLTINLKGKITSVPYIHMTLSLLKKIGIKGHFNNKLINILPLTSISDQTLEVESDWSSASYYYSLVALSNEAKINLSNYHKDSLQGDAALAEIYNAFGVSTTFGQHNITLKKHSKEKVKHLELDLSNTPDIAQTIAITCFGLGISCELKGLHTLKIKETDRLAALKKELEKLGAIVSITQDSLELKRAKHINNHVSIDTYNDHRMAMAFTPLALKTTIYINNAEVVSKSYPSFWQDMNKVGIASYNT